MHETTVKNGESQQIQGFSPSPNYGTHPENNPKMGEFFPEVTFSEAQNIIEGYQDENFVLMEAWQNRVANINRLLAVIPASPFAWYAFSNIYLGIAFSLTAYVIAYITYKKGQSFLADKVIECYANIKENIYVYHESPKDKTVFARKKHHVEMLEKANNLTPLPVRVVDIYFKIGEHCNETWNGGWPGRLIKEIDKDRAARHKKLARDYPLLYKKYILKQEM